MRIYGGIIYSITSNQPVADDISCQKAWVIHSGAIPSSSRAQSRLLASASSAIDRGLNRSTQHFILEEKMECLAMSGRFRRGFSVAEKTELWDRWQRGKSLKAIGRAFGKPSSSIYYQLAPHGGISPASRHRSRLALTLPEREEISRGIASVAL